MLQEILGTSGVEMEGDMGSRQSQVGLRVDGGWRYKTKKYAELDVMMHILLNVKSRVDPHWCLGLFQYRTEFVLLMQDGQLRFNPHIVCTVFREESCSVGGVAYRMFDPLDHSFGAPEYLPLD